ncbi:hypothetical protein K458DRAFT_397804 [Lentithecium fluviatile CBS 122367]|uniref:Uncharacterized protein n=1 Tax=Lentithecium fluviatile CBS 122367 TaxID=1168545 RepID=A0A6G1IBL0_9PLEO|nr:hypothetical protein K458DRAFT_397804 [Lentithecium fluviatile CBS 122367]
MAQATAGTSSNDDPNRCVSIVLPTPSESEHGSPTGLVSRMPISSQSWETRIPGTTRQSAKSCSGEPQSTRPTSEEPQPTTSASGSQSTLPGISTLPTSVETTSTVYSFTTTTTTSTPIPPQPTAPKVPDAHNSGRPRSSLSELAIGGIVASVVITITGLVILACLHWKRRQKDRFKNQKLWQKHAPPKDDARQSWASFFQSDRAGITHDRGDRDRNTLGLASAEKMDVANALRWAEETRSVPPTPRDDRIRFAEATIWNPVNQQYRPSQSYQQGAQSRVGSATRGPLPLSPALSPEVRQVMKRLLLTPDLREADARAPTASGLTVTPPQPPHALTPEHDEAVRMSQIFRNHSVSPVYGFSPNAPHALQADYNAMSPPQSPRAMPWSVLSPGQEHWTGYGQ